MKIKTTDGEMNVTTQGQGTLNTVLGAVGAAAALGIGTGIIGNGRGNRQMSEGDRPVTRYELSLIREGIAKDNEICMLKSQQYADRQVLEAERRQVAVNTQQVAYNATNNALLQGLQQQVVQLQSMMKVFVPSTNIVDMSVTPPTVSSATTTTNNG